jgi:CRP-like cAMP-binding protein
LAGVSSGPDRRSSIARPSATNRLLEALPRADLTTLEPDFERVKLAFKSTLHEPGSSTPFVHFPDSGVLSVLTVLADGSAVELGHVGNEGMVDISVFLGLEVSESRIIVQVPGSARRMHGEAFRRHLQGMPALRKLIGAYVLEFFTMVAQTAACNRRHPIEQRLARWILMTHDRVAEPVFPVTQEFLAEMLGAARPKVTRAAQHLRSLGLIAYERGTMHVVDRAGLEAAACECYQLIWDRFERFEGPPSATEAAAPFVT